MSNFRANAGFQSAVAVTASDTAFFPETNAIAINASVAGNVSVTMVGGQVFTFPVVVGLTIIPLGITQVRATLTTATAVYTRLN